MGHMTRQQRRNMMGFSTGLTFNRGRNAASLDKAGRKAAKRVIVAARKAARAAAEV